MKDVLLNFDLPLADVSQVSASGRSIEPPIAKSEHLEARHASATGALSVTCWTERQSAYLQLVSQRAISDHEAAAVMHYPLSSINSVRGALKQRGFRFRTDGFDVHTWITPRGKERITKRARWTLVRSTGIGG